MISVFRKGSGRAERRLPLVESMESRVLLSATTAAGVDVTTWHGDANRDGWNAHETTLTPANVHKGHFGKLFTVNVDGAVYAQPLYLSHVNVPGKGVRSIVLVATQHDSVYAFDAKTGAELWKRSFIDPAHGITTVSSTDVMSTDIAPEIGITGTPVIDKATGTIYFVTKVKITKSASGSSGSSGGSSGSGSSGQTVSYEQRLRSLDVATGKDKFGGSVVIGATVVGAGAGRTVPGSVTMPELSFDPLIQNQRPALALVKGVVYVGYGSHGDNGPYNGWLFGYNARSLKQTSVFVTAPDGLRAPIWEAGGGPTADANGNLFVATGNGTFDVTSGGRDYGGSILRLNVGATGKISVAGYFTPYDVQTKGLLQDQDLGSTAVVLIPNKSGGLSQYGVIGDKQGKLYLFDPYHLGGFHADANHIFQTLKIAQNEIYGTPAYFGGTNSIYVAANMGKLEQFSVGAGHLSLFSQSSEVYGYPGATPTVSSNGNNDGIVWAIERRAQMGDVGLPSGPAILHAYSATNLGHELYSSDASSSGSDYAGQGVKFTVPTVADGEVFVGAFKALSVYGLLS